MDRRSEIRSQIKELVMEYFAEAPKEKLIQGKTRIPLIPQPFSWEEVYESIDSLLSTQLTMGAKVKRFESMFAQYIGVRSATMVNSGSSANLLALSILTNPLLKNRINPGDEIITPAVTWATTVWPIINCGAVPVLVDVDLDTFNISSEEIKKAITDKTRAIMLVHLLGNPCDMDKIISIAKEHNLYIIEDACEAHGAEFHGQKVGSFGDLATFSFFFSHHITTVEGGMVLTNNEEYTELSKALRTFGWIRDLKAKDEIAAEYEDIDPRFLFVNIGYNLRPTEIQGAFGIHQLGKLDNIIEIRRENAKFWTENLSEYEDHLLLHREREGTRHVWFAYPITIRPDAPFTRKELVEFLESKGVETRPIMSGNIDEQPAMGIFGYRKVGELKNSRLIMRNSFLIGNHQRIGNEEKEAIIDYIGEFMSRKLSKKVSLRTR
ncbi:aminotransferase class I/II-fold pyridoxal phosphate-dependent enzyme [bacterium]|nr:aminotransferase class I/II-fold pyridoxal phosphate-dependent enzyme [bacterium]